ncbi:MAG TPA: lytic transglycosylase domain-containing protein [Afipia sp.]
MLAAATTIVVSTHAEDAPSAPAPSVTASPIPRPEEPAKAESDDKPAVSQQVGQTPNSEPSAKDAPATDTPVKDNAVKDVPAKDVSAKDETTRDSDAREAMCLMIESAASAHGLPLEFFARVIWQESRFQPDAVGPMTRSGQRAQGVAQFMPGTASERRLLDPFDPVQALPKSAEFLSELRAQFGNLGLAAAAYNSGPRRVQEWLASTGYMPSETRNYVYAITGSSVDEWARAGRGDLTRERDKPQGCRELMALLRRAPNPFVAELEQRVKLGAAAPWGVQLAAGFSRDKALAMYARAMKRLSSVVGDRDPSLLSSVMRTRGSHAFYQVRIGADTRQAANDLCGKIQRAGGACMVLRNPDVRG